MPGVLWHGEGVSAGEQVNRCFVILLQRPVFACATYTHLLFGRFSAALQPFRESLQMVQNHLLPGKLTWPFTKELVVETQPNYLKVCGSFVMRVYNGSCFSFYISTEIVIY